MPPTNTNISSYSTESVSQEVKVTNSMQGEKPIMLKLKIVYKVNGQPVSQSYRYLYIHIHIIHTYVYIHTYIHTYKCSCFFTYFIIYVIVLLLLG